ncbi:NADH-quinone oxidoreductase subunit M [Niabella sp. CC-SYL272]|uniref:complex I subunit 4 family protein n=1 Tax=Niabella agricola TaxID=2891571 RepID=UPI001F229FB2|nr:NADH-quinone oxidoreductase subunit M [Niabella agricola]MCF3111434.1 NADH-quinone oxidoreductase subunit M [Niabella agricola]
MIALLLILVPLVSGLATFLIKKEEQVRTWSLLAAISTFIIAILGVAVFAAPGNWTFRAAWMGLLNSSFSLRGDGMGIMLCMLTALCYPVIFLSTWTTAYKKVNNFFGLMLLAQAGLMGVFLAMDALLFYFFWELALIPVYFICSQWGGEKRIAVTFKFFIYTFIGSLLMLVGILYVYAHTPGHSFDIEAFYKSGLSAKEQTWLFWLFFVAFAVKMPIFPFHTWQPDTYQQSPTAATMVLSALMVKMGVLGLLRWLLPVFPIASYLNGDTISLLAVTGIIYASLIAMRQDDMKRLVAYSSIAHIGLMCVAVFAEDKSALQGTMIQMFSHGINILGMWMVVAIIERKFGTVKISALGGIAQKAPALTFFFVIIAFANIALPLTNAFIGEFLMFKGILGSKVSQNGVLIMATAGVGVILGAVYTLRMGRKVFFGETNALTEKATDISFQEKAILAIIIGAILIVGIYPQPFLNAVDQTSQSILKNSDVLPMLMKQKH